MGVHMKVLKNSNLSDEFEGWDDSITEMMINVKAQKTHFGIMLVFGFSIDDFRNLVSHSGLYRTLQFAESFPIGDGLDPKSNKAILKFEESMFEGMNGY